MKIFASIILYFIFLLLINASDSSYFPYTLNLKNLSATKPTDFFQGKIAEGKKIFISRKVNCLSCHEAPVPEEKFQGNLGPSLHGLGNRYSREEIRIRIIDSRLINEDSIMPSYFKKILYPRVGKDLKRKKILTAEEVEHLVEYLYSFK